MSNGCQMDKINNNIENGINDDEDPIPSGTGNVSKDCSPSDLEGWGPMLNINEWHNKRPKGLAQLVRMGIPEALRAEAWQRLSGCSDDAGTLMEQYRILLTQTAPTEDIIKRDVERTYPAHPKFRSDSSDSQVNSLFKVCKAWAVYDQEVGYCQGLSFLVATLLLHMPEEQAFCVFVRIMESYGLRDLFRANFHELHLKLHQLDRLIEDQIPALHKHFKVLKVEPMMFASQWFLTVFTAKFPLNAVFHIVDLFLLDGIDTLFLVSLALLQLSKQDLLALDYEGIFKYFSVQMPKRYTDQINVQQLIKTASELSLKRLKYHAKSYKPVNHQINNSHDKSITFKYSDNNSNSTIVELERDNKNLTESYLRLLQENNNLVHELARTKVQLQTQMDDLEDKVEQLQHTIESSRQQIQICNNIISDLRDEKSRLEVEVMQLKEVCRRELHPRRRWRNADAVCLDVDSTVCRDEAIDELAKFVGKFEEVSELTRSAMRGNSDFREALRDRLAIIKPTQTVLKEYISTHPPKLTDGIEELIILLKERRVDVYLISGGFDVIIEPTAKKLGIPMDHVYSNSIKFYFDGSYAGFDETRPTSRQDGKPSVIASLKKSHGYKNLVMIGDGVTDLEACPPADAFIGFGANQAREPVKNRAEWFVYSFRDLIQELNEQSV
ncbi:Rab GTPase-activating protein 1, partial [Fragariocoptes setiger]